MAITGDLHQTWLSGKFGSPTAQGTPEVGPVYHQSWVPYDSHLLITDDMLGGGAGADYRGISETNDGSNPVGLDGKLPAVSGFPSSTVPFIERAEKSPICYSSSVE